MNNDIYILAIESSCDDTSAAVLHNDELLSNVTASQAVHEAYVPISRTWYLSYTRLSSVPVSRRNSSLPLLSPEAPDSWGRCSSASTSPRASHAP